MCVGEQIYRARRAERSSGDEVSDPLSPSDTDEQSKFSIGL
jgi:hypothetical protein